MNTTERIAAVNDKIQKLLATGITAAEIILSPAEFRDLTAAEFADLSRALPDMELREGYSYYTGTIHINGVYVAARSADNTRLPVSNIKAELDAMLTEQSA